MFIHILYVWYLGLLLDLVLLCMNDVIVYEQWLFISCMNDGGSLIGLDLLLCMNDVVVYRWQVFLSCMNDRGSFIGPNLRSFIKDIIMSCINNA